MISRFNRMLYAALTRRWDRLRIDSYAGSVHRPFEAIPGAADSFRALDVKATGTLTHVSVMIAGLGLIAPMVAQHWIEEGVIIGQIAMYLLIAVGCLRCLSVFNPRELGSPEAVRERASQEMIIRHELYAVCNRVSIAFTAFVFLSLPLLWLWVP